MEKPQSETEVSQVRNDVMNKNDWFKDHRKNQHPDDGYDIKPQKQDFESTFQTVEIGKKNSQEKIHGESAYSEGSQFEEEDMLEEEKPAIKKKKKPRRRYPNISKNISKNLLKFLTDTVLTRRWQQTKLLIEKMNHFDPDPTQFAQDYKEYLTKVEQTHKKQFNKTDMVELLTHTDYGRTTRILFDRLRRKGYDSRMFYSKIQNFRQHLLFKKTLKKILKDPERFLRIRL